MIPYRDCFQHLYAVERKRIVMPEKVTLRLNRGERPDPMPLLVQAHISNRLAESFGKLNQYPSYSEFYEQLAKHHGINKNQIVVGAGIEEFIRTLTFLCCDPGQQMVVTWPSCAMYDIYSSVFGVELVKVKPAPGENFSVDDIMQRVTPDTRLVFLPSPGQPVGTSYSEIELRILAQRCASVGAILAVDEAHWGFGSVTALPLINKFENLIVLRTFSKFYGAASIRVGYAIGSPKIMKPLEAARPSGEIAGPSMVIASTILDYHSLFESWAKFTAEARDWTVRSISKLGLNAYGGTGFSVLVEFASLDIAVSVASELASVGVLVKAGFPSPVHRCILLACGTKPMMKDFMVAFEKAVHDAGI